MSVIDSLQVQEIDMGYLIYWRQWQCSIGYNTQYSMREIP